MTKDIKDYLHLYLGCQIFDTKAKPDENISTMLFIGTNEEVTDNYGNSIPFNELKPILRPLSSMTEEHLLEVMKMCYRDVYGNEPEFTLTEKVSDELGGGFIAENDGWRYGLTVTETGINFSANGSFLHHNPFEIVNKLYKWGYDLHKLIESGLAIDATTLNKTL